MNDHENAIKDILLLKKQVGDRENLIRSIKKLLLMAKRGDSAQEIRDMGLEMVVAQTQSEGGYFHFFDERENVIDLVTWSQAVIQICDAEKTLHYPIEEAGIWADSARQRKTVVHNDYQAIPDEVKGGLPEGHFPLYRHMSVPVFDQDKLVAMIGVGNKEEAYLENDVEMAEILVDILWSVLLQRKAHEILEKYSFEDGLTGIANRRRFNEIILDEWNRARRNNCELALVMIDIDFFKRYNDTLGHSQGDICLIEVARALQKSFRRAGEVVARYGGEEFVVVIPNTTPEKAKQSAEFACRAIEAAGIPHPDSDISEYITVSIGVANALPKDDEYQKLIEVADKNLYTAKEKGRNQVVAIQSLA